MDAITLRSTSLTASISLKGAEIKSLRTDRGIELIWCGDSVWWDYSAPFLFPVIGTVAAGTVQCKGEALVMPSHGIARISRFVVLELETDRVNLVLRANDLTRQHYPFDFVLRVEHRLQANTLHTTVTLINSGEETLPASFGFHPALRWPMTNRATEAHRLVFEKIEQAKLKIVNSNGQLEQTDAALSLKSRELMLTNSLFTMGALVLDPAQSRTLKLADDLGPLISMRWTGCNQLGLWTKPGAPFICIEPWAGYPTPVNWTGPLEEKPGSFQLKPAASQCFSMAIDCASVVDRG